MGVHLGQEVSLQSQVSQGHSQDCIFMVMILKLVYRLVPLACGIVVDFMFLLTLAEAANEGK
jgi:hypothetical protein